MVSMLSFLLPNVTHFLFCHRPLAYDFFCEIVDFSSTFSISSLRIHIRLSIPWPGNYEQLRFECHIPMQLFNLQWNYPSSAVTNRFTTSLALVSLNSPSNAATNRITIRLLVVSSRIHRHTSNNNPCKHLHCLQWIWHRLNRSHQRGTWFVIVNTTHTPFTRWTNMSNICVIKFNYNTYQWNTCPELILQLQMQDVTMDGEIRSMKRP